MKRSTLKSALEELVLQVEDAFLLGQLRDNVDADESAPDHTTNVLERSKLLGVVEDASGKTRRVCGLGRGRAPEHLAD